jgi:hypothetical protein
MHLDSCAIPAAAQISPTAATGSRARHQLGFVAARGFFLKAAGVGPDQPATLNLLSDAKRFYKPLVLVDRVMKLVQA